MEEFSKYFEPLNGELLENDINDRITFFHKKEPETLWVNLSKNDDCWHINIGVSTKYKYATTFILDQKISNVDDLDFLMRNCTPLNQHFDLGFQ